MSEVHTIYFNTASAQNHSSAADYSLFLNHPIGTPADENYFIGLKSVFMCGLEERLNLSTPVRIEQEDLTPHKPLFQEEIPVGTEIFFSSPIQLLEKTFTYFSRPDLCKISITEGGYVTLTVTPGFILHLSKEICQIVGFRCFQNVRIFRSSTKADFSPSLPPSLCLIETNLADNTYFGSLSSPVHECVIPTDRSLYFKHEFLHIKYFPIEFFSVTHINVKFRNINFQLYPKFTFPIILEFILQSKPF